MPSNIGRDLDCDHPVICDNEERGQSQARISWNVLKRRSQALCLGEHDLGNDFRGCFQRVGCSSIHSLYTSY